MDIKLNTPRDSRHRVDLDFQELHILSVAVTARLHQVATSSEQLTENEAAVSIQLLGKIGTMLISGVETNTDQLGYLATCLSTSPDASFANPNEVRIAREMASQLAIERQVAEVNLVIPPFLSDASE
jgi:hypothetical protein